VPAGRLVGDWKPIRCKLGGPLELYDLAKDLGEAKNIADRHPDVIDRIEAYLQTARTDSTDWPLKAAAARNRRTSEHHSFGPPTGARFSGRDAWRKVKHAEDVRKSGPLSKRPGFSR